MKKLKLEKCYWNTFIVDRNAIEQDSVHHPSSGRSSTKTEDFLMKDWRVSIWNTKRSVGSVSILQVGMGAVCQWKSTLVNRNLYDFTSSLDHNNHNWWLLTYYISPLLVPYIPSISHRLLFVNFYMSVHLSTLCLPGSL